MGGRRTVFISDVVDQLDMSEVTARYERERRGGPPYHPRMMVKRPDGMWFSPTPYLRSRMAFSTSAWRDVGLQFQGLPIAVGDEAVIAVWRRGRVGNRASASRRIALRLHEDIAFRVLAANNTPDFRTISDFGPALAQTGHQHLAGAGGNGQRG